VLSYPYWITHFDGNAAVIGRTVRINKQPYTIVGVAPEGFRGTILFFSPDLFVPLVNQPQLDGANQLTNRGQRLIAVIGHLKPGVTPAQAVADLDALGERLASRKSELESSEEMLQAAAPPAGSEKANRARLRNA